MALYLAYIKYRKNYIKKENVVLNLIIHIRKKKVIQKKRKPIYLSKNISEREIFYKIE